MHPSLAAVLAVLGMLTPPPPTEPIRMVEVSMRTTTGLDLSLVGPQARLYRAQPEIMLRIRPSGGLAVLAGGGLGPALVVRGPLGRVDLSVSGAVGVRFPVGGTTVSALTRAESVVGGATTLSLAVQLSFGP
jgi:hypothetical protein